MEIRPAGAADAEGIAAMVARRVRWLEERGVAVSTRAAADMAEQAGDEDTPNWVLLDDAGAVMGCTTTYAESPAWAFAPELVRYYTRVQGWSVLREVERRGKVCTLLSRAAEERPDLDGLLSGRSSARAH